MKKYVTTLLFLIAFTAYSFGQSCPKPDPLNKDAATGTWKGAYSLNGEFVNFIMKIGIKNQQLTAELDIPKMKTQNIVYDAEICRGQELHLKSTSVGSSIEFIARPKANGTMSGRVVFDQNGAGSSEEVFTAKRTSK